MKKQVVKEVPNKHSKIFIIALVSIALIALIGINLNNLTGEASKNIYPSFNQETAISIPADDKFISAGDYIHITVNPGYKCVNRIISIYDDAGFRRATVQPAASQFSSSKKLCQPFTVNFKTYADWKPSDDETGIFFIKVFDYQAEDYVSTIFTIK